MKKLFLTLGTAAMLMNATAAPLAAAPSRDTTSLAMQHDGKVGIAGRGHQHAHSSAQGEDEANDEVFAHPDWGAGAQTFDTTHFRVHYTLQGENAVSPVDNDKDGTPDYVARVAATLEHVRDVSVNKFGWAPPPADGQWGGNGLYDVYLENLAEHGLGGVVDGGQPNAIIGDNPNTPTVVETQAGISYMSLDKAYEDPEGNAEDALQELQSVAAHEFLHSIQFGYDANESADWLWEATANWMMEEVYDANNMANEDLFNAYDSPDAAQSGPETDWYAGWIFFRYLSERHGHAAVKAIWEEARTKDGYDAIAAALQSRGITLDAVMRGYSLALLTNSFSEGATYPTVRLEGAVTDQFQPTDGVASMGADYAEIRGTGPLTVKLAATNLEGRLVGIRSGRASVFTMTDGQATVDRNAFDHLYLIVQNLQRPTPETEVTASDYKVMVAPGTTVSTSALTVDAPNFKAPEVAARTSSDDNDWGFEEDWANDAEFEDGWAGDEGYETNIIEAPAYLIPGKLPAGYEFDEAFDDGDSLNVLYLATTDESAAAEKFIMITMLTAPVAMLAELGIDETVDETVGEILTVNGHPTLIEQADGVLYATFVQNDNAYMIAATLSQADALTLIQSLPKF